MSSRDSANSATATRSTFGSSVGTKIVIGVTGLALFIYLLTHIAGNLLVFLGPTTFNHYAHTLTSNPLIPVIEIGLLLIFLIHVVKAVKMYFHNRQARPVRYAQKKSAGWPSRKSVASSTMIFSGLWLLLFVIIHVKAFKYGPEYAAADGVRDLYRVEMENFSNPLMVAFYVVSMLVVGSHLSHGISSSLQSLGFHHQRWTPTILVSARVIAAAIAAGFIVIALWAYVSGGAHS